MAAIQLQVLNSILQNKDASLITLNNLNADYFSSYRNEFNFIKNHIDQYGNVPDMITFVDVFNDFEVINVEESQKYLIENLYKEYKEEVLRQTFNRVGKLYNEGKIDEALKLYNESNERLNSVGVALECVDITKDTSRYERYVEKTQDLGKYYVKTGLKELDDLIGGWDRQEELATVIARTNQGKSWILLKFAEAAVAQGLNVGLYSGEMSEDKVGYRFDTLGGHVSNGALTHGNVGVMQSYQLWMKELPHKYTGSLKVLTPAMINGPAGVSALRAFVEKYNLDMLFIDQHSLLEDDRKAKNPVEKAANISKDLKNLQVLKHIPIISVSQMNRSKNDDNSDTIDSAQIAQSDRIGQDSTIIIGLSRDKKDNSLMRMQIVKSRDSENGKVLSYIVDLNQGKFTFVPEEEKKQEGKEDIPAQADTDYSDGEDAF